MTMVLAYTQHTVIRITTSRRLLAAVIDRPKASQGLIGDHRSKAGSQLLSYKCIQPVYSCTLCDVQFKEHPAKL